MGEFSESSVGNVFSILVLLSLPSLTSSASLPIHLYNANSDLISCIPYCESSLLSLTVPSRNATFTLTNVVPQNPKLNQNAWRIHESQLTDLFREKCSKAYVLVGAVPSANNWIIKNNVKRVNIPDYLWNAYCCVDNNNRPVQSGAATARNTEDNWVEKISVDELGEFLQQFSNQPVGELFYDNCRT